MWGVTAEMTFMAFARKQLIAPEMRPFTYGMLVAFLSLGSLSIGGTPEARAASKYINPPKHH